MNADTCVTMSPSPLSGPEYVNVKVQQDQPPRCEIAIGLANWPTPALLPEALPDGKYAAVLRYDPAGEPFKGSMRLLADFLLAINDIAKDVPAVEDAMKRYGVIVVVREDKPSGL